MHSYDTFNLNETLPETTAFFLIQGAKTKKKHKKKEDDQDSPV